MDWKTPRARTWRSLSDIATDWAIICLTVWIAYRIGVWASIAAIFVIGNRQRALGNLLHEGGHQNLSNSREVNDRIAGVLLAPPLFNELTLYRLQHAWHHGSLGDPVHDPDYLASITHAGDRWFSVYLRVLTTPSIWAGSVFGHFINMRLALSWLAAGFAICMLACNVVLVRTLFLTDGLDVWLRAPVQFLDGLQGATLDHTAFTVASVALMVICGADYQQFVLAARTPAVARNGCLLAAGFVFLIGFLPASAVIAASPVWHLQRLADPVQVIPVVLIHTLSGHWASTARTLVIVILLITALGAGCSILRAMADATVSLGPRSSARPIWSRVVPIALGTIVAIHGQSLVDMMVDVNMVYITAVGPLVGFALLNRRISDRWANATLAIGSGMAIAIYLARWTGLTTIPETNPLTVSFLPLLLIAALLWRRSTACQENERISNS